MDTVTAVAQAAALPLVLDAATFDVFARTTGPRLLRIARLLAGEETGAQDLVQHALSVVWERREGVLDPDAFVRTVLVRRAASRWRRRWTGERPTAQLPEKPAGAVDVDVAVVVQQALACLSRRERSVLVLRYFEDLSVGETARTLDLPETTVTAATRRGLERLRAMNWDGVTP